MILQMPKGGEALTEQEIQQSMTQDTDCGGRALFDTYYN
jgi:hypothetical protein